MQLQTSGYVYHRERGDKIIRGKKDISAPLAAESSLAIWSQAPDLAKTQTRQLFGKYYGKTFQGSLTGAQVVVGSKILRYCRKKSKEDATNSAIVRHGTQFVAMLMGHFLLKSLGKSKGELVAGTFKEFDEALEKNEDALFKEAVDDQTGR